MLLMKGTWSKEMGGTVVSRKVMMSPSRIPSRNCSTRPGKASLKSFCGTDSLSCSMMLLKPPHAACTLHASRYNHAFFELARSQSPSKRSRKSSALGYITLELWRFLTSCDMAGIGGSKQEFQRHAEALVRKRVGCSPSLSIPLAMDSKILIFPSSTPG